MNHSIPDNILQAFPALKRNGSGWKCRCPAHEGNSNTSLSLTPGDDGRVLVHCFAGCSAESVCSAVGLRLADLMPAKSNGHTPKVISTPAPKQKGRAYPTLDVAVEAMARQTGGTLAGQWEYTNSAGELIGVVARLNLPTEPGRKQDKTFRPFHPEGDKWYIGDPPRKWPVYGEAIRPRTYLVEGEACCERVRTLGLACITSVHGADGTGLTDWSGVEGVEIVALPDNDEAGESYIGKVAAVLRQQGCKVRVIRLREVWPDLPQKGDVADMLGEGGAWECRDDGDVAAALDELADDAPEWAAESNIVAGAERPTFNRTDLGNVERLIHHHGADLRYVAEWNRWLAWTGSQWKPDSGEAVYTLMEETIRGILVEAAAAANKADREALAAWALSSENRHRIESAIALARWRPGISITPDELDRDPLLLNTRSGTVDLRTGKVQPASRGDLCTKVTGVSFDPNADCPTFLRFMARIFADDADLIEFVQRLFGYAATGSVIEQILALAIGCGQNGKTTLFDIIMYVLGDYACKGAPDLLTLRHRDDHPTNIADLCGRRLVVISEVDDGVRWNETRMKDLTGESRQKARVMRGDYFEFAATHKLCIFGNSKPVIRGTDLGVWRRIRLIPFDVVIPKSEVDRQLPQKLQAESAGILRWLVEGAAKWHATGLGCPSKVALATAEYRIESDTIGSFIEATCIEGIGQSAAAGELFKAYTAWCAAEGERPVTQTKFGRTLDERGFKKEPGGRRVVRLGISLRGVE